MARAILGELRFAVVSAVLCDPLAVDSEPEASVTMRTVTWADLATWSEHPQANEFRLYYEWKRRWSRK